MLPRLTALAESLPASVPFVGPETTERLRGRIFRARLGANENGFGPSPHAVAAMERAAGRMWCYGDPESFDLKAALADHLGCGPEHMTIGEGIDGLLGLAVRLFVEPGATVVSSKGAYPTFNYHVAGFGGRMETVAYRDDREDLQALLDAAVRHRAPMVYLANPDNPMGTWWSGAEVRDFAAALPATTLLILDEAYGEFAPGDALPAIQDMGANVLRMRTFSKAYGLAGLRLGYAIGAEEIVRSFDKVRNHFGLSLMAQVGCLAALQDQNHLSETVHKVARARDLIAAIAADNGLSSIPSGTNFVAIDCAGDGALATRVFQQLEDRDVFVRKPNGPGIDRCIRVSAGPDDELNVFAEMFPAALEAARRG